MGVNDAGDDRQPGGVDGPASRFGEVEADGGDSVVGDGDVGSIGGLSGAIDDLRAVN